MEAELRPGVLSGLLEQIKQETLRRHRAAFGAAVEFAEARMKMHAGEGGAHRYGTPTPASRGRGPAVISGDLRRSIMATPIEGMGGDLRAKVGPSNTPHRTYPPRTSRRRRSRSASAATSAQIAQYLEDLGYPFVSTTRKELSDALEGFWRTEFDRPWR